MRGNAGHEFPVRPLIPVTAAFFAGLVVGSIPILNRAATVLLEGGELSGVATLTLVAAELLLLLTSYLLSRRLPGRLVAALSLFGFGVIAGSLVSHLWYAARLGESQSYESLSASAMTFVIDDDSSISDQGYSFSASVSAGDVSLGKARLTLDQDVDVGSRVRVIGRIKTFSSDDYGRSRVLHGELRRITAIRIVSVEPPGPSQPLALFRSTLLKVIDAESSPARALIAGVVCGRATELRAGDAGDWFSRTGTSHLIAVSGTHLALVGFLVDSVLVRFKISRRKRSIFMASVCVIYTLFTGASPSAVRSCCMVLMSLVVSSAGRRTHSLSALFLTASGFVLINPSVLFDLGFQLSCVSVFAIVCFGSYASYAFALFGLGEALSSMLAISLVAQVATIPFAVPVFGGISLMAPLANACIGPVMSFLLTSSIVLAPVALIPVAPSLALALPTMAGQCTMFLEQLFASVPMAYIPVATDAALIWSPPVLALVLYAAWPKPRCGSMLLFVAFMLMAIGVPYIYWDRFAPAQVIMLDVGQADCILVRQGTSTFLVDAGVDRRALDALLRNNVHHVDTVFITHWDEDHWGGLPDILDAIPVERIVIAEGAREELPSELAGYDDLSIDELHWGDSVTWAGYRARCIWPQTRVDGLDNEDSLCLLLEFEDSVTGFRMLLTGDAERDQEHRFSAEAGDIDVLKIGHHGSKVSVDAELLDEIKPELAIASAGENNRYGHPSQECIDAVLDYGARFACTIDCGDITLEPTSTGIEVKTQKQGIRTP